MRINMRRRTLHADARALVLLLAFAVAFFSAAAPALSMPAASGTMILSGDTLPGGAVWLNGNLGGHLWVTDNLQGICRVDPAPNAIPPWQRTNCNGTAKSGGQVVVGNTPTTGADGSKYVYVADDSSKSVHVVRFLFTPGNESLSNPLTMTVLNLTFVGGGSAGGRVSALALAPNGTDLYVGYLDSGDIMRVSGAMTTASQLPPQDKIGNTSDGRGVYAFVMFGNDLYLAERGGFGLSVIPDPSGVSRPPCTVAAQCKATTVKPTPSFFPGGLATDGTYIYIGDAPIASPDSILRYNPATGAVDTYSNSVTQYVSQFDGMTRNTYYGPLGLGLAPNGDLYVGDDPTFGMATPPTQQGHIWKVPFQPSAPTVTTVAPNTGTSLGGDTVTVSGTGFSATPGTTTINFGNKAATNVTCTTTQCTATSPAGTGVVDVIAVVGGQPSASSPADQFTYVTPPPANGGPVVNSVAPNTGAAPGGTIVTITGTGLVGVDALGNATLPAVVFGANAATNVHCVSATSCTAVSPAGTGTVDVQVTVGTNTSAVSALDRFTYVTPTANFYAWGITAPKGGAVWLPGNLGGHWWSSDHAQGLCRQDPVPGTTLHAINFAVCGSDLIGSAGQAVYDPRTNVNGTHYVYVPDNAVKSTAVWRLTFDPTTETMVADPAGGAMATAMIPLADVRTLKPNGMALGPLKADGTLDTASPALGLFVSDLTEMNIRKITGPEGDPRLQTVSIVAVTGDGRGANGTQGFIGNNLYISENRGAAFFDVTQCPTAAGPCATTKIPLAAPAAGVFVAGTAVDPVHGYVYVSDSPGGANATIYRWNAATPSVPAPILLTGGVLPAAGTPNATVYCALTCQRPWDFVSHPTQGATTGFAFAFGLAVAPDGTLVITEDPSAGARSGRGTMWTVPFVP